MNKPNKLRQSESNDSSSIVILVERLKELQEQLEQLARFSQDLSSAHAEDLAKELGAIGTSLAMFVHLAHHDPLTNLPNRTIFCDRLKQSLAQARRHGRSVGVIFLDLDRFKIVNDAYGHEVGDALLRAVADRLMQCVRSTDTVARLSGDEFAIILQDLERGQDAGHVAQNILHSLSRPVELNGRELVPHASLGIGLYPGDATDPNLLIAQADRGMYRAKERGGACYQFYCDELNAQERLF